MSHGRKKQQKLSQATRWVRIESSTPLYYFMHNGKHLVTLIWIMSTNYWEVYDVLPYGEGFWKTFVPSSDWDAEKAAREYAEKWLRKQGYIS